MTRYRPQAGKELIRMDAATIALFGTLVRGFAC